MVELVSNVKPDESSFGPDVPAATRPSTAELAECTCPEFCERDHDTD
jgi:hypothetical protein